MPTVLLLAAGASSRMRGGHKLLLPFGHRTLLEATLTEIESAGAGPVIAVIGHEAAAVREVLSGYSCVVVENPDYALGMSASIRAGVARADEETSGFMLCLADMPLIPAAVYGQLLESFSARLAFDPKAIVQPQFQGRRGHPVLFSSTYRHALQTLKFGEGAREILHENSQHIQVLKVDTDAVLLDIDTEEDYRVLLERLAPE